MTSQSLVSRQSGVWRPLLYLDVVSDLSRGSGVAEHVCNQRTVHTMWLICYGILCMVKVR